MSKVFNLADARKARDAQETSPVIAHLEECMFSTLRKACFHDWDARTTLDKFFDDVEGDAQQPHPDKLLSAVASALNGNQKHLATAWVEVMPQYLRYLKSIRYHLATGRQDLIIEDGLQYQGSNPFPEPMLITGFGTNPFDDYRIYASASLSARNIWFDGEFQDFDGPAVSQHPETPPRDSAHKNIVEIPHINYRSDVETAKRGMLHPTLLNNLIADFFMNGIACNSGIDYSFENKRHRFSYLETVGLSTIIEWSMVVHSEIYEVYGL